VSLASVLFALAGPALAIGCSSARGPSPDGASATGGAPGGGGAGGSATGGGGSGGRGTGGGAGESPCLGGARTTLAGTVYDPSGRLPLYNVSVYVPSSPLAPLNDGASCMPCAGALSGNPIVQTRTDAAGRFTLTDVPPGSDVPLVIQAGKWRRQVSVPSVAACTETLVAADLTHLPRGRAEGHIPRIAVATGGRDALECLLRKIGIYDSEFTPESAPGRITLFAGGAHLGVPFVPSPSSAGTDAYDASLNGGARFRDAETWWERADDLARFDAVLLSCEGAEMATNKSAAALQAMQTYANMGGRIFASHWHNHWIERGPDPFPTVAMFNHRADPGGMFTVTVDTSFEKGRALADWLVKVGASLTPGELVILGGKRTVTAVNTAVAQRWIYSDAAQSVQYMSFGAPVGAEPNDVCGKVVFSDLHVTSGAGSAVEDDSDPSLPFPTGCRTTDLSPQEKALVFMLFDLSGCIEPGAP
jgi:hypothetical protein